MGRPIFACVLLLLLAAAPSPVGAQSADLAIRLPSSLILPNYDRIQIGQREGIEAGAYVARTDDAAANWYNPAGLMLSDKTALAASANAYEWTTLRIEGTERRTGRSAFNSVNALVAALIGQPIIKSDRWRLGFSYATPVNWQPAAMDYAFSQPQGAGEERFAAYSAARLTQSYPAVSAGYQVREGLRLGATLSLPWTSLYQNQVASNTYVSTDTVVTATRTFSTEGSVAQLQFGAGLQWDITPAWTIGVTATTPGTRLFGSSLVRYDGTLAGPSGNGFVSIRDDEAEFEYRNPLRLAGGIAWRLKRGSIEADVRYYGATGSYAMFSSDVLGQVSVDTVGAPSSTQSASLVDTPNEAEAVLNFSLGARYELKPDWTLNLGFYTDGSPVGDPSSSVLRKLDMWGVTLGSELRIGPLSGAVGLAWSSGKSDPTSIGTILGGRIVETEISVSSLRVNYALSYAF